MTKIMIIGDVHRKWDRYVDIISNTDLRTIQVGDFGWGFQDQLIDNEVAERANRAFDAMSKGDHTFIRGNHDNPAACSANPYWIPDGTFDAESSIYFVGGAKSTDWARRKESVDWWRDEELTYAEFSGLMDHYYDYKPNILITHDMPEMIVKHMRPHYNSWEKSVTRQGIEGLHHMHQPMLHLFGHWHGSWSKEINGTRFVCLKELETVIVDTETLELTYLNG